MEKAITFEDLVKAHGEKRAKEIWAEVCAIGGYGTVSPHHSGGLDINGLAPAQIAKIKNLAEKKEEKKEGKN